MNKDLQNIVDYLIPVAADPFPRYIFKKEILRETSLCTDIDATHSSKWYKQLADEQWKDGSWGRFHSQDSKAPIKQKFVTTEAALRRARELGLTKDDPIIEKCIKLMERYVSGEETWTDNIEKQKDNGKGHMFCRPYMSAAAINTFDPENPLIKPLRDNALESVKRAFENGFFDEQVWEQDVREYRVPSIAGTGMDGIMLFQSTNCMEDNLQKQYLEYIWNGKNGIYYVSSMPSADKRYLEDKRFFEWLSTLELLSGFSLFPEFMKNDALPHLLNETNRLINDDIIIPASYNTRYAESWRDKNNRKNDVILRILRLLVLGGKAK
jgi:hypothetical protein